MKRPILGLLAAVLLALAGGGISPARAATSNSVAATATPMHGDDDHHDGYKYSHPDSDGYHAHRDHPRHGDDDDHDDHDGHGRRRRCEGLIVVCLI